MHSSPLKREIVASLLKAGDLVKTQDGMIYHLIQSCPDARSKACNEVCFMAISPADIESLHALRLKKDETVSVWRYSFLKK